MLPAICMLAVPGRDIWGEDGPGPRMGLTRTWPYPDAGLTRTPA
jgi:hypothetical protein